MFQMSRDAKEFDAVDLTGEILRQVYEKQLDGDVRSVEEAIAEGRRLLISTAHRDTEARRTS